MVRTKNLFTLLNFRKRKIELAFILFIKTLEIRGVYSGYDLVDLHLVALFEWPNLGGACGAKMEKCAKIRVLPSS